MEGIWAFTVIGGALVLGLGMAFAREQWEDRRHGEDPVRDEATRPNYLAEARRENRLDRENGFRRD